MSSKSHNLLLLLFFALLVSQLYSCAGTRHPKPDQTTEAPDSQTYEEESTDQPQPLVGTQPPAVDPQPGPRAIASLEMTAQGKNLLSQGQPDAAIRLLERAVQLNPINGENYYYLAEAWIMKETVSQAREFNDLAQMYFVDDQKWLERAKKQRKRIDSENGG